MVLPDSFNDKKFKKGTYSSFPCRERGVMGLKFSLYFDRLPCYRAHISFKESRARSKNVRDNVRNETQLSASIVTTNLHGVFSRQLMWFVTSFQNHSRKTPRNSTWYMQLPTIMQYVHQHPETAITHF